MTRTRPAALSRLKASHDAHGDASERKSHKQARRSSEHGTEGR